MDLDELRRVPSDLIPDGVKNTLATERRWLVENLWLLSEMDARRLYLKEGSPDLFRYMVEKLHIAEPSASKRLAAARTMRRHPEVADMLRRGESHLSGVYLVSRHIQPDNARQLLDEIRGKTRREVEEQVATRFPEAEKRPWMRPIQSPFPSHHEPGSLPPVPSTPDPAIISAPLGAGNHGQFLSGTQVRLAVTIDRETYAIIERLARLSPGKPVAAIIGDALRLLRDKRDPDRRAAMAEDRRQKHEREPVPAAIRHRIFSRDAGRCTYVGPDGVRCSAQERLQLDHIIPVAKGGTNDAHNLRLRCAGHNLWGAIEEFGESFVAGKIAERRGEP